MSKQDVAESCSVPLSQLELEVRINCAAGVAINQQDAVGLIHPQLTCCREGRCADKREGLIAPRHGVGINGREVQHIAQLPVEDQITGDPHTAVGVGSERECICTSTTVEIVSAITTSDVICTGAATDDVVTCELPPENRTVTETTT